MPKCSLQTLVRYCDKTLKTAEFTDWPGAVNGLQVENNGSVTNIAATVDASMATIKMAVDRKADLLLVHHGLFWTPSHPWTGKRYQMIDLLVRNNLAVYSSHLPLDAHPTLGNNSQLGRRLGFGDLKPFFFEKGQHIGLQTKQKLRREELHHRLNLILGREAILVPGGPETCQKIGIVTGGAGDELKKAFEEGVDTFITGEGRHWTFALAEELGMNVFYGGHYATETFGVKALAEHLSKKFRIPSDFIDYPTGL
jgi:dinuclear metal center YbgI/SA1388 family protein